MSDASILPGAPFPPLRWDEYAWAGEARIPSWAGFQPRMGAYGAISDDAPSDGSARLSVTSPDEEGPAPPTPAQAAALRFLLDNDRAVTDAVLRAIFATYPTLREQYGYDEDEAAELLPAISSPAELKRLVGFHTIHLLEVEKDGMAYVGIEGGCSWDEEHGVGVMTHGARIVELGGADTSFLEWIAQRDADGTTR
jgi:hypothetical protein